MGGTTLTVVIPYVFFMFLLRFGFMVVGFDFITNQLLMKLNRLEMVSANH